MSKDIYFNNQSTLVKVLDEDDLKEHNADENAHKSLLAKYTLQNTIGIWKSLHNLGENYIFEDESTEGFAKLGCFICTYNAKDVFNNQPSQYGQLLSYPTIIEKENNYDDVYRVTQLWFDTDMNELYIRTGSENNNLMDQCFDRIALESDNNAKSGTVFPVAGANTQIGDLFYRTDSNLLYLLAGHYEDGSDKWVAIFDPQYEAGTAKELTNPWFKLDSVENDNSIDEIEDGESLNIYTDPGVYSANSNEVAASLYNTPTRKSFRLVVMGSSNGVGEQLLFDILDDRIYTRRFITITKSDDTKEYVFGSWNKLITKDDTIHKADIATYDKNGEDIVDTYARKDDLSTAYIYRGSVDNYSDLPKKGMVIGDIYNINNKDTAHGIDAGDNVAWNGTTWDNLSGIRDLSAYAMKVDIAKSVTTKALTVNGNGKVTGTLTVDSGIVGSLTGNATSANKVNHKLTLTGLGSGSFDGSSDVSITINTNSDTTTKLKNARTIQTDLTSLTAVEFDGTKNITPGVTGILAVGNGGTGANSLSSITVGNASKVNNHTVKSDVPENAVFTDTKYDDTAVKNKLADLEYTIVSSSEVDSIF